MTIPATGATFRLLRKTTRMAQLDSLIVVPTTAESPAAPAESQPLERSLEDAPTEDAAGADSSDKPKPPTGAQRLIGDTLERFNFGHAPAGEAYAVPKAGPHIALPLRGSGSLQSEMILYHTQRYGQPPNASALASALGFLEASAQKVAQPSTLDLRVAKGADDTVVLDLGDPTGRAAVIKPKGWEIVDRSPAPVLFRRTKLTAPLPTPEMVVNLRATLGVMRALFNVTDHGWALLLGWLVSALIPGIPRAILLLQGEQGTGKSDAAKMVISLVDPTGGSLLDEANANARKLPRDEEDWSAAASASWAFAVDNVSYIPEWWSDALCRTATGAADISRQLYFKAETSVLAFRRAVILTAIHLPGMRDDLGSRVVNITLEPIHERRPEAELFAACEEGAPRFLGALFDLVSGVLREYPVAAEAIRNGGQDYRLIEFATILGSLDRVLPGLGALEAYTVSREDVIESVLEGDEVAIRLQQVFAGNIATGEPWEGTMTRLLHLLTEGEFRPTKTWPRNGRALSSRLTRLAPALRSIGIDVVKGDSQKRRSGRKVQIKFRPAP